ncbi:aminodeoxychorismate/anthranilate synthase component II [Methanonatronarchaeum sp. AMET6-2]|uniref:anthranilate synthase component II n=1 Tax=Methanonatronarchaeum sp. AMET6-2 TaxID=2933293 RepID=UPI001222568F|nr:aminodeoxychorismate/anthranilate synthase component II [Methanonatronarchaeum sp. AMET6-2]RZN61825.1 MAG: aminodeoxychorismate/anthranilate synthase component II [Methanonatronarchaeia archaeon]UOY09697.1 aminodeoxychorismate/anthranilate synthase component II [Methanonatronarchaeum sp. AMET6-2]
MKVLIIDCYDSFTYNIYQMVGQLGAEPVVIKNDMELEKAPTDIDRLVLSPGPGKPDDAGNCIRAIDYYEVPTLGICLGHQVIAQKYDGEITKMDPVHGKTSEINHENHQIFEGIPQGFRATRYHSLCLSRPVPKKLRELARAKQDNTVMAVEHRKRPLYGVQFHPESIASEYGSLILNNFIFGE